MIAFGLVGAFATLLMAGCGATALLMRGRLRWNAIEFFSLSVFFGGAVISLLLWGAGFFMSGPWLQIFVATCAVVTGVAGWRETRRDHVGFVWPRPRTTVEWILVLVLASQIVAVVLISLGKPLGWDSSFNWEIKARFAFLNGGALPPAYYQSQGQALTHPEYPLFIPFTQLWIDMWIGAAHQFWEKTIFPITAVSGVLLLGLYAARLSGRRCVGLLAATLIFFNPYLARGAGGITSGYVDLPLGLIYFVAIANLLLHRASNDAVCFRIYAAALPLLPWLKREGAMLWLVAAGCGLLLVRKRLTNPKIALALSPGLLVIVTWAFYLRAVGAPPSHDFGPMSAHTFAQHIAWCWPIAQTFVLELMRPDHWSLFWILVGAALVQQVCQRRRGVTGILALALIGPLTLYASTYLFSAWPDYLAHMRASLPRLILQLVPLGALIIATTFRAQDRQSRFFLADDQMHDTVRRGNEKPVEVFS